MFAIIDNPTDVEAIQQEIVSSLQKLADPEAARTAQRFFPKKVNCFGVRANDLRALSRQIHDKVRTGWKIEQALELAESLFNRPELEARSCGLLVLSYFRYDINLRILGRIRSWLEKGFLNNWALVDTLSLEVLSPFFLRNPAEPRDLESWAGDKNNYVRRAALVALVKLARDQKNLNFIFRMVRLAARPEKIDSLVAKAAGWLLREAGKSDRQALERFLIKFGKKLPRVTVRYALEKFPARRREHLLKITKNNQSRRQYDRA